MKKILLLLLVICGLISAQERKTVCLNMIVKNESKVIERCLDSVKPLIDYWVIVDTGSSDGTQKIIKKFMKGIPGELHERPWVNFGHNRNEALQLAKNKGDYLLFIDADENLVFDGDFVRPDLERDAYQIVTHLFGTEYTRVQMVNNKLNWKWMGVLHEYLDCPEFKTNAVLTGVTNYPSYEGFRSQDPQKFMKDAAVLEEALNLEPDNSRYVFYLAQSYRDADQPVLALKNYEKRAEMGGWDQEVYFAKYQVCLLQQQLKADPEKIAKSYLDCYSSRPTRAEPLCHLAQLYRLQGNFLLGYLVASHGLTLPYPTDNLFVERWVYDYGLMLEKSVSAYWIGRYQECLDLSQQLLKVPNLPANVKECVEKNIWWAQNQLAK